MVFLGGALLAFQDKIKKWFGEPDYSRGLHYFQNGKVISFMKPLVEDSDAIIYQATVKGSRLYHVLLNMQKSTGKIHYTCDCPRFEEKQQCKHVVATLLMYNRKILQMDPTDPAQHDRENHNASPIHTLLNYYKNETTMTGFSETPVQLEPSLSFFSSSTWGKGNFPSFSLKVGREKMYVVRNIRDLLNRVYHYETFRYGKELSFQHTISAFTPHSQKLIRLLALYVNDEQTEDENLRGHSYFTLSGRDARMSGGLFAQFFQLYLGETMPFNDRPVLFAEGNPALSLHFKKQQTGYALFHDEGIRYLGNEHDLYALEGDTLYHTSEAYRTCLVPLLKMPSDVLQIDTADMPAFAAYVLSEIEPYTDIHDPEEILAQYRPDELEAQFYLDLAVDGAVIAKVDFQYGDTVVPFSERSSVQSSGPRRNLKQEQQKQNVLKQLFTAPDLQHSWYYLNDNDKIYDFLTDGIQTLFAEGNVLVSDQLYRLKMERPKIDAQLSVSHGNMILELDTGEIPVEELRDIFLSMIQKKRYHKLRDGRFLTLQNSGLEELSELEQNLQLDADDLAEGRVEMPIYRVPYVDTVLDHAGRITIHRDADFRQIARSFKTVDESEFSIPTSLEKVLRPYQRTGFRWLRTLDSYGFGGILADDMGLGKSVQLLSYLLSLKESGLQQASLIVCPASLVLNWEDECQKFAPSLQVGLVIGTPGERADRISSAGKYDVLVTSYELLRRDTAQYLESEFYAMVLDEAQYIKNSSTKIAKAVKKVRAKQHFALTGTPIENRLSELWSIFDFLMPGYLYTRKVFTNRLEKPILKSQDAESMRKLSRLVKPFILRRMKSDVLKELPEKIEQTKRVEMGPQQRSVYLAQAAYAKRELFGEESKIKFLAELTHLRQICCDPALCVEHYTGGSAKLDFCVELVENAVANGHNVLLFSQFTTMLERISDTLEQQEIPCKTLQGSTTKQKRAQLVSAFNNRQFPVFLISLKAGGTGLNLTTADVVIHYDPWWNIAAQNQATDRAHRIGQTRHVNVYRLIVKDSIEEKILALQEHKRGLMRSIEGDTEGSIMQMSREAILELLDP